MKESAGWLCEFMPGLKPGRAASIASQCSQIVVALWAGMYLCVHARAHRCSVIVAALRATHALGHVHVRTPTTGWSSV